MHTNITRNQRLFHKYALLLPLHPPQTAAEPTACPPTGLPRTGIQFSKVSLLDLVVELVCGVLSLAELRQPCMHLCILLPLHHVGHIGHLQTILESEFPRYEEEEEEVYPPTHYRNLHYRILRELMPEKEALYVSIKSNKQNHHQYFLHVSSSSCPRKRLSHACLK